MASGWTARDIVDLDGKTFVVTGANAGLGLETTRGLARKRAKVVMACRTESKAKDAITRIRDEIADADLQFVALDLADLESVTSCAERILVEHPRIDVLINNAGVMALPLRRTRQGFEMQMGTNHFGHFALTGRLLPALRAVEAARVVTITSNMHQLGKIRFDDLDCEHDYQKWLAYGHSKLANLLFTYELQRRAEAAKLPLISVAAHPGYANTQLQTAHAGSGLVAKMFGFASKVAGQDPEGGALPSLYAATANDVRGGEYYGPGTLQMWGAPKPTQSNARSHDEAVARRLWEVSEERTGVTYDFGA